MGLALNKENYKILTIPKRAKNESRRQQALKIKRNEDGVFVKSNNTTKVMA